MKKSFTIIFFLLGIIYGTSAQSWATYYDSTEIYWNKNWEKCIDLLEKAIPLAAEEMGKDNNNYAVLLNDLGLSYWYINNFEKASALFEETLRVKKAVLGENDPDYAATLLNVAGTYREMGKIEKSENLYQEAIKIYSKRHENYSVALNNLGLLKEAAGDFREAEKYFTKAVEAEENAEIRSNENYATSLNNLASLYRKSGRYEDSEVYYKKAINIYLDKYGKNLAYAKTKGNLGVLYQTMGRYSEAEKLMLESVGIMETYISSDFTSYANILNNLGGLYKSMGNYEAAQRYYKESQQLYMEKMGKDNPAYATSLNNMAGLEMAGNHLDKAEELYLNAAEIFKNNYGELHPSYSGALNNLASLYRKKNDYKKAESHYLAALDIDKEVLGEHHPVYASTLGNLALLYIAMGQNDMAEEILTKSIAIKTVTLNENHPSLSDALNNLAILHFINENYAKAEPLFLQAIKGQLNQIKTLFPSMSEREKEAFYATLKSDLERFNTFAVLRSARNPEILGEMYNNQLATKGLIFRATDKMRDNILSSGDERLINDYNKWKDLKDELAQYYRLPISALENKNVDLESFELQLNVLEKNLSQKSALFAEENNQQEITWKDIQNQLNENEAAIEIIRFRDFEIKTNFGSADSSNQLSPSLLYGWTEKINYGALIVTKGRLLPELVLLENGRDLETKYFSYYKNAIRFNTSDNLSYRYFWQPIAEKLDSVQKFYFSPDGVYFKINLNTIALPENDSFIMDEINIQQVTNTKELLNKNDKENTTGPIVLVGAPAFHSNTEKIVKDLPGTKKEVEEIAFLSKKSDYDSQVFTGEEASEEMLKNLKSPKVLHIATHGYFSDNEMLSANQYRDNPLFNSGLMLAGAGNTIQGSHNASEDGLLTAYEAMNLNLDHTDMVVLSACETGLGEVKNGEGVYGLQRAFKVAGAKSIILSLWKVDDVATRKLFTYFYEDWLKNGDKRKAFKSAQEKLRIEYPSSYYWGAFVMVGE